MRNRQVLLASRPTGIAQAENFSIHEGTATEPADGQIVVRNAFLSVEPAMRGWIADLTNYAAPVAIGSVMRAITAGVVIASRAPGYAEGDKVMGWFGWQEIATVDTSSVIRTIVEDDLPLSLSLGVLGINGVTALLGLTKLASPKPGMTVVVSTAAGAVGSAVGQISKLMGCRAIGIAGGPEKVAACVNDFGYDAAFDYHADDLDAALTAVCPDGVDIYFDNVAGRISDTVYRHLALHARVIICGTASISDWSDWPQGPRIERHLLVKRARAEGFVMFDFVDDYEAAVAQLATWIRAGKLTWREDILDGLDSCPDAIAGLYRGENMGKRLIRL